MERSQTVHIAENRCAWRIILAAAIALLSTGLAASRGDDRNDRIDRVSIQERDAQRTREREAREAAKTSERGSQQATEKETKEAKAQEDVAKREAQSATDLSEREARTAEDAAEAEAKALEDALHESGSGGSASNSGGSGSSGGSGNSGSGSSGSTGSGSSGSGSSGSGSGSNSGSSGSGQSGDDDDIEEVTGEFKDLAAHERPEFDPRGFPARRGEVVSADLNPAELRRARELGFSVIERLPLKSLGLDMVRLRAPTGVSATDALRLLNPGEEGVVDYVHFYAASAGAAPGGRPAARIRSAASKTLWVGMIDTAIAPNRAIQGLKIEAHNFSEGAAPVAHGTAVASILRRVGAARVSSANVFTADTRPYAPADRIVRAIDWMVERHVPVINISIAGPHNAVVNRAIAQAVAKGHIVVAAAGNGGPAAPPAFPGASPGAVAVTAVDSNAQVYLRANHGSYIDVATPGVGIAAALPDGSMKLHSGTSFAAPLASAWLARCAGNRPGKSNRACVSAMEAQARDLGAPGRDPVYGYGLIIP